MKRQALRTSVTLYRSGALDLETAATHAGVEPERIRRAVDGLAGASPEAATERDRVALGAD